MTSLIEENKKIADLGARPLVAIPIGTKNGERFLVEQLGSLANQSHQNWVLTASDDGFTDKTV